MAVQESNNKISTCQSIWPIALKDWGDGSGDLALPLSREMAQQLDLDENTVVEATIVEGRLLLKKSAANFE